MDFPKRPRFYSLAKELLCGPGELCTAHNTIQSSRGCESTQLTPAGSS